MASTVPSLSKRVKTKTGSNTGEKLQFADIDILIGVDYCWDILHNIKVAQSQRGVYSIDTDFGTIHSGIDSIRSTKHYETLVANSCICGTSDYAERPFNIEDFWNLEAIGIQESATVNDDDKAIKQFQESISFTDKRYEVRWPWKSNDIKISNNYSLSWGN